MKIETKPIVKQKEENYDVKFSEISRKEVADLGNVVGSSIQEMLDTNDFSGGILVAKNGQILFEKYNGFSSYKLKHSIKSNTALHLASVSKTLTSTAILRLVDQKKIELDQHVDEFLPSFPYPSITIRNLLSHRSGLQKYEYFTESDTIWGRRKILSNQDVLRLLEEFNIPLYFTPDSKFAYSNTNYAILALVIEQVTGETFPVAMNYLIFKPLKMRNSFVFDFPNERYKRSQSYKRSYEKLPFTNLDAVYGDKNIYSTPRDLLKYDLAMYNETFLSTAMKEEMYKGYSYERKGVNNYGLGIRVKEWENGEKLFYHHGWWHGNTATYITLRRDSVTIIALSNKYNRQIYHLNALESILSPSY